MSDRTFADPRDEAEHLRVLWTRANDELSTTMQGTEEWAAAQAIERQTFADYVRGEFEKR